MVLDRQPRRLRGLLWLTCRRNVTQNNDGERGRGKTDYNLPFDLRQSRYSMLDCRMFGRSNYCQESTFYYAVLGVEHVEAEQIYAIHLCRR